MLGGLVRLGATVASYGFSTSLTPRLAGALGERGASALRVLSGKLALQNRTGASNLAARAARFVTPYASESGSFLDIMNRTNEHIINRLGGSGTRLTQAYAFLRREAVNEAYSMPAHLTWYSVEKNRATSREEKDRTKSFMSWYFPEQVPYSFISGVGLSTVQGSAKGTVRRYLQRRAETRPGGNTDFLNAYIASARTINRIGDEMTSISMAKRATFEDKSILYATDPRRTAGYYREFRENLKRERAFADLTRARSKMTYGYLERDPYAVTVLRQMRDYKWKQEQYLESLKKTHGITKDSDRMGATGESFAEYAQRFRNSTQGFTEKMIEQYNKVLAKDSMFIKRWNKYFSHDGKGEIARHREMFAPRWELGPGEVLSDTVEIGDAARRLSRRPYEMYVDPAVMRLGNADAGEPQRVVDLHRMGSSYMIDSAIRSSGKGLPGFLTSLFGLKEVIQFQRMESQLGTSFESFHRGGNLVFPFAIRAQTGSREMVNPDHESLTDLISRSLVFEDSSPEKRQHIADAVIRSRKSVLAQHPDLRLYRDGSMSARKDLVSGPDGDAILDTMLSKGVFPVGKGDTLVHLPGGEMYLTTSVRVPGDNAQTAIMDLGRFVSSKDPVTFLKYTSADSAPTRAIRSFHGMQSVRVGAGAYETNIVVGPNQTGRVIAEYTPGMFGGKSAAERFDLGASKEMGILRRWKRFFTKWTDPKNPHVLYSEDYLGDPRGRFIDQLVEESGHSLRSANDLSNMLRSQGTDMWDSIYVGLLKKRHMTTRQLYAGVKEHPTPWFRTEGEEEVPVQMGELIIKHTDSVEDAARKKDLLLDLLTSKGKDDSLGANMFRDDIMTLTTIGSQLVPSADRTAGEILGATRASRQAYVGYRKYDMSNLDVYNATVMKVVDSTAYIDNTIYGTPAFPSIFGNMKGIVDADTLRLHDHARRVTGIGYELKKQIMDTDQFDSDSMRGTQGRIQTILRGFMGETSRDMDGLVGYFRSNRKHAVWSIADADTREKVSPSPWGDTFLIAGSHPDAGIVKKHGNTTTGIMDVKNLSVMTLLHAFNRAASEFLDIGFDEYLTSTPGQYASKLLTKRVLPFMGIYAAYIAADRMTDYWMDGTPLGEGIGVAAANAVAGARLTAQGVMDLTGITHVSKWAEDLMPGIIESPLSGAMRGIGVPLASIAMGYRMGGPGGALTGGAIGSAVGMLLGGGPAGLFGSWNPDKSRAEIIEELTGEQEVPIRSGRWWELNKAAFEGDRISYYRPHLYSLMRAKAKRTPGNNDSLITELVGHVAPDIYAVKNYYSRPYPKTAGIGANIPIFGNMMAMAPGLPIGGGITMHGDELSAHAISEMNIRSGMIPDVALLANDLSGGDGIFANTNPYGQDVQSDLGFFPGFAGPRPIEKSGFQWAMGESVGQMKDIVGLRGFLGGVAFQAASGHQDFYDSAPEFDTPASVNNFSRLFYDRNLGGLAGACVAGDQLVDTINGLRRIDNIKVGDLILSRDGQYRKVLTVFKRERQETLFAVRCDGLPFDLRITGNHKVIVHRKRPCIDGNKKPCVPSNNNGKCIGCPKNITIDDPFCPTKSIHQDSKWAATSTFYYTGMTQEAAEAYEYAEKHGVESLKVLEAETGIKCSSKHTIYDITRMIKKGNSPDRYPLMVPHFEKNSMSTLRIGDYLVRAIHEIADEPEMIIDLSQYAGEYPFTNKYIYSKRPSHEYIAAYEFLEERYNSGEKLPTSTKLSKQLNIPRSVAKDVLKRKRNNTPPTRWERYVTITSELAYFFGWYVAEGNVDEGNVCLAMHRKELNYATQLSEIIMRTFSRPCKIQIGGPNGNSLRFKFHHPVLALFLPSVFGSNCYTKMIPSLYWRNNKKVAEQYLRGLFLGDGCNMMSAAHRSQDCSFHTTSISLAVTFHDILAALDICSSIGRSKAKGKNVESYIVHINKHNSMKLCNLLDLKTGDVDRENFQVERDRVFIKYGFVHYPIRKIEKDDNQEKRVFDLEVEEVHYYHANQICISNSEILRRYMPKRRGQIDVFNPIRSSMPDWLPGPGSFIDLQTGDAMTKIPEGEVRLPGAGYLTLHDVDISMPITSDILGQDYESQVAYLLGISSQVQPRNVQMSQAKAIASMLGRKAEEMGVLMRNNPAVYDPHGDVMASADFVANIGTKGMMPVKVAPKGFGGEGGLNAFMVLGGFEAGQLIEVDPKSGRYTPRIIRKDIDRYVADLEDAKASREAALSMIPTLESRDKSFNLGNAYSWADRFKILGDVAPYSHEFERTKNVMEARRNAGVMSGREERIYDETLRQNEERRKAFSFNEYRFMGLGDSLTQAGRDRDDAIRDEYSMTERAIGGAWEYMTHLRTPINTKLLGQYSALEEYRRTSIYGTKVPMWENPIDDYLLPYAQSMVNEDDPLQAGLSFGMGSLLVGAAFGGAPLAFTGMMSALGVGVGTANRAFGSPDLPDRVEKRRDIQEQVDAVNYAKNMLLESETGLLQYRYAAQRTFTGMALSGQIPTVDDLRTMMPFPERDFVGEIISNVKSSNIDAARAMLPKMALPTLEQEIGNTQEAGSVLREVADSMSERSQAIPGIESTIYGRNVPISAPAITTYEQEGLSAHDGGFGWYKQMSDINTMKAYGVYSSRDSIYGTASPHVPEFERGDSVRSAINMNNALRSRLSVFGNVTISGEGDGFGIIVEIIQTG